MDEIRAILKEVLADNEMSPPDLLIEDILQRLKPYLKGPKIPIKRLNDLKGWLQ